MSSSSTYASSLPMGGGLGAGVATEIGAVNMVVLHDLLDH